MEASFESRNTRRSATNLHHLTLAPLSSRLPIDADLDESETDENEHFRPRSSYIQGRSAPTTPHILSRSSSRHRLSARDAVAEKGSKSFTNVGLHDGNSMDAGYGYGSGIAVKDTNSLTKSKSTTVLVKRTGRASGRVAKQDGSGEDGEWLFRAGVAISSEARETKGQSWLVSRESSTSLVLPDDPEGSSSSAYPLGKSMSGINVSGYAHPVDSVLHGNGNRTPRSLSRAASRSGSKPGSAYPSRHASRVGSKTELTYFTSTDNVSTISGLRTPASSHPAPRSSMEMEELTFRTGAARERDDDYFGPATALSTTTNTHRGPSSFAGPDFVDAEEAEREEEDDQEDVHVAVADDDDEDGGADADADIAELARRKLSHGFGLGSVVDRMINWTLFEVNEDGKAGDSDTDADLEVEQPQNSSQQQQQQQRRVVSTPATQVVRAAPNSKNDIKGTEEEGGWRDAAWLLSIASKVLL